MVDKPMQAKVARVLTQYEVALNRGSEAGIKEGDVATIFRVEEIRDPDTKDVLGGVKYPKLRFRIYKLSTKFAIGRTYQFVNPPTADPDDDPFSTLFQSRSAGGGRRRVQVTADPAEESWGRIFVSTGEGVEVTSPKASDEDEDEASGEAPF